jgi:hypothetical protein
MHWLQAACLLADIAAAAPSTEQHNTAIAVMDAKIPVLMILSPIKQKQIGGVATPSRSR